MMGLFKKDYEKAPRSAEYEDLIKKVRQSLARYQGRRTGSEPPSMVQGAIAPTDKLYLLGYKWSPRAYGYNLQEAEGFHGGDVIGVAEQKLRRPLYWLSSNHKRFLFVLYQGGKGELFGYARFDPPNLEHSTYYELPHNVTNGHSNDFAPTTTLDDFIDAVKLSRGKELKAITAPKQP